MSFISYAQNFEDVMLWRALKHVENGFYIDVGANDPTLYSVTRAFYDAGWSGINLEPVTIFFNRLQEQRPRDKNLRVGVGSTSGSFPFYDIPDSGLATSDASVAEKHRQNGWNVVTIDVPVLPLTQICQEHVSGDIHFLKIDVEGAEKEVLAGMDFQRWRPWILVVEATTPMSQDTVHHLWEPLVLDAGYEFVYFDGLNRYYVAQEHAELKNAFTIPPNVFDGFVLNVDQESKLRATEADIRAAQSRIREQEANAVRAEAELREGNAVCHLQEMTARALQTEQQLVAVYASFSWRVTRPIRDFKEKAVRILARCPFLDARVRKLASRIRKRADIKDSNPPPPSELHKLPQSARKVLLALQRDTEKDNRP